MLFQLEISEPGKACSAEVELEGIADSWDAYVKVTGHPVISNLRIKFWMGSFILPVFESRADAIFFEPLLEAIDEQAKKILPEAFH